MTKRLTLFLIFLTLSLTACDQGIPKPPDVKFFYMVDVNDTATVVMCQKYEVLSYRPFKIKRISAVSIRECDNVSGYRPEDQKKVLNWIEDLIIWGEQKLNDANNS